MAERQPLVVIIAGPNGAGKSTTAPRLLRGALAVDEFVNADTIASGLSAFRPEAVSLAAGRVMLDRLRLLAGAKADFAFETTLASRSFATWLTALHQKGYHSHLIFLSLPSSDLAEARVRERVLQGGHAVAEQTIRRRFTAGLGNFFSVYCNLVTSWQFFDNAHAGTLHLVASRGRTSLLEVHDCDYWKSLNERPA